MIRNAEAFPRSKRIAAWERRLPYLKIAYDIPIPSAPGWLRQHELYFNQDTERHMTRVPYDIIPPKEISKITIILHNQVNRIAIESINKLPKTCVNSDGDTTIFFLPQQKNKPEALLNNVTILDKDERKK